jgi:hypothetical protein
MKAFVKRLLNKFGLYTQADVEIRAMSTIQASYVGNNIDLAEKVLLGLATQGRAYGLRLMTEKPIHERYSNISKFIKNAFSVNNVPLVNVDQLAEILGYNVAPISIYTLPVDEKKKILHSAYQAYAYSKWQGEVLLHLNDESVKKDMVDKIPDGDALHNLVSLAQMALNLEINSEQLSLEDALTIIKEFVYG